MIHRNQQKKKKQKTFNFLFNTFNITLCHSNHGKKGIAVKKAPAANAPVSTVAIAPAIPPEDVTTAAVTVAASVANPPPAIAPATIVAPVEAPAVVPATKAPVTAPAAPL